MFHGDSVFSLCFSGEKTAFNKCIDVLWMYGGMEVVVVVCVFVCLFCCLFFNEKKQLSDSFFSLDWMWSLKQI